MAGASPFYPPSFSGAQAVMVLNAIASEPADGLLEAMAVAVCACLAGAPELSAGGGGAVGRRSTYGASAAGGTRFGAGTFLPVRPPLAAA